MKYTYSFGRRFIQSNLQVRLLTTIIISKYKWNVFYNTQQSNQCFYYVIITLAPYSQDHLPLMASKKIMQKHDDNRLPTFDPPGH